MFIDGVPVTQATALQTITNPARIEVMKGPQSATFGRQTFAGAINVVTKDPSAQLSGSLAGMVGTRANYDVAAELSGPLAGDLLGFRATARAQGKNGSYKNAANPGQTLGDQSSKSGTLALTTKPAEGLTIKAFGLYSELSDGPSAQGVISAYGLTDPTGRVVLADQSNCNFTGTSGITTRFICGVAPRLSGLNPVANTANTPNIVNFLQNPANRVVSPDNGPSGFGLTNKYYHVHLDMNWEIGSTGLALRSLTGWNRELKSELADLDNLDGTNFKGTGGMYLDGFYNYAFLVEAASRDFSQELRLSFENGGPLHAAIGGSYLNARTQSTNGSPNLTGARRNGATQSRTFGAFFSLGYDFSPEFSLSADGRYQVDKLYAYAGMGGVNSNGVTIPAGFYAEDSQIAKGVYKKFLPRVIAKYDFGQSMVYASYSQGVNPGAFNTLFITSVPAVVAEAQRLGYRVAIRPEKITNYEIGAKGKLLGNTITYDLAAFYAIWDDQIQSQSTTVFVGNSPFQVFGVTNSGKVRVKGVEANVSTRLSDALTVDLNGAFIDTFTVRAVNSGATALTGMSDFRGKEQPFTSKWSGTASLSYAAPLGGSSDLTGFGRADFVYKSGNYSDVANIVRSPDMNQVNVRAGIRNETYSVEVFATNLFNNRAYYNVSNNSLTTPTPITPNPGVAGILIAQLRELRTLGIRASFNF